MTVPVLVTVQMPCVSGLPEDTIDTDFAILADTLTSGDADAITATIAAFYNDVQVVPGTDRAICMFLNRSVSRDTDAAKMLFYDLTGHLDGSDHGSPAFTRSWTVGAEDVAEPLPMPNEVAACLSFHGDLTGVPERSGSTRPAARRRGRVFLGPLNVYSGTTRDPGDEQFIPSDNFIDVVTASATFMMGEFSGAWCVWSRADAALYSIVGGYIDNAFDTQRRRGVRPTARVTW